MTPQENNPFYVDTYLARLLFHTRFNYRLLLNAQFGEVMLGKGRFLHNQYTGHEFNERLREVELYDVLRIREPDECIPYEPGMNFKELPVITLEEVRQSK